MGLSPDTVPDYFTQVVSAKMLWRPVGVVLHNTEKPTLAEWLEQPVQARFDALAHYYGQIKGWPSGPHCIVDLNRIWIVSPPWKPGTGSPSWDADHFHLEFAGDYNKEIMLPKVRENGLAALVAMYQLMGKSPTPKNLRFHKEDPKTRHKRCPGVNVGSKYSWIKSIREEMGKFST